MVVVFESHLEIKTGEFRQVPMGVRVFGPEHGPDLVHPLHISSDGHLLSQLRGLSQEGWTTEVVNLEHGRTGLSGGWLEFWGLDFGEALRIKECSEKVRDAGAHAEDGMGDRSTEVNNSIGETSSLANARVVSIGSGELGKGTTGILDLEWE